MLANASLSIVAPLPTYLDSIGNQIIEDSFYQFALKGNCTADGRLSWIDLQKYVIEATARDGEALIQIVKNRVFIHGIAFHPIESDQIDEQKNEKLRNGREIRMGVEVDAGPHAQQQLVPHTEEHITGGDLVGAHHRVAVHGAAGLQHELGFRPDLAGGLECTEPGGVRQVLHGADVGVVSIDLGLHRNQLDVGRAVGVEVLGVDPRGELQALRFAAGAQSSP